MPRQTPIALLLLCLAISGRAAADTPAYCYIGGRPVAIEAAPEWVALAVPPRLDRAEAERLGGSLFGAGFGDGRMDYHSGRGVLIAGPGSLSGQPAAFDSSRPRLSVYRDDHGAVMIATGRLAVELQPDADPSLIDALRRRYRLKLIERLRSDRPSWYLEAEGVQDAVPVANRIAEEEPGVRLAEVDFLRQVELRRTTDDPYLAHQWHLRNTGRWGVPPDYLSPYYGKTGADIRAHEAWEMEMGSSTAIVAVVDDGVQTSHPDLFLRIVPGYDFVDDDDDPSPPATSGVQGPFGHGTAVAGVAAATGENGTGVAGVCPNCSIMPIRLVGSSFSSDYDVARAWKWAFQRGAAVLNNSWGYAQPVEISYYIKEGIDAAIAEGREGRGTAVVFAAGNDGRLVNDFEMEMYGKVIAVGASTRNDSWASYSSYGNGLDLVAPSGDEAWAIVTTDITGDGGYNRNGTYWQFGMTELDPAGNYSRYFSGTSAAAPVVSGVIGLLVSYRPTVTWEQIRDALVSSADKVGDLAYDANGFNQKMGHGRVNARAALEALGAALPCGGVTDSGECRDGSALWCDEGRLQRDDCPALGRVCEFNADLNRVACKLEGLDNCQEQNVTYEGSCEGDIAIYCDSGTVRLQSCVAQGKSCGWHEEARGYRCISLPESCGGVSREGACDGGVAVWCLGDGVHTEDCRRSDITCGWDTADHGYRCIPCAETEGTCADATDNDCDTEVDESDECRAWCSESVSLEGRCEGDTAVYCDKEAPQSVDCAALGARCAFHQQADGYRCVTGDPSEGGCAGRPDRRGSALWLLGLMALLPFRSRPRLATGRGPE